MNAWTENVRSIELEERGLFFSKQSRVGCEQKLLELKGFVHFLQNSDSKPSKLVVLAAEFYIPCVSLVLEFSWWNY